MLFLKNNFIRSKEIFPILLVLGLIGGDAFSQELLPIAENPLVRMHSVRIGPHPSYTRILIDLSRPTRYKIRADFPNKKIILTLENVIPGPRVRAKSFRDKNLDRIAIDRAGGKLALTLFIKSSNTRIFHFMNPAQNQIILDLKGGKKLFVQAKTGRKDGKPRAKIAETVSAEPLKRPGKPTIKVAGMTPQKLNQINRKDIEGKVRHGWDDYQGALEVFQKEKYQESIELFERFVKIHPDSKYLSHVLYLTGEAEFNLTFKEEHPLYENSLAAYKYAMRMFPKSEFYPHALSKISFIYDQMGYTMEAKTLYEEALKQNPKGLYAAATKSNLAAMMMKEEKYEEAYKAFSRILKNSPKSTEARSSIFVIAEYYFEQKRFKRAIEIYEDGERRWPEELNDNVEIHFNMGEIYYSQKRYALARKHFFDLINLDPDSPNAHKALNRIGDSYLLEGKDMKALSVFDESARRNIGSAEMQYGKIRMADIGIRNPRLEVHDIIFDSSPYYQPFETYARISAEAKDEEVLAESTLSRGIAYFKEQNYLKAIEEFKKLVPLDPDSRHYRQAQKLIKQALILLIDRYSKQDGVLPILYSYSDFVSLSVGTINNLKTLLQIGEAYQAVGMFPQALKFFERVKQLDSKRTYTARIFINLGWIHLEQKNFPETRLVARSFMKNYPRSPLLPKAMKLLAASYTGQNQHKSALKIYRDLLKQSPALRSKVHYLIAETHTAMNKQAQAIGSYRRAIATYDRKTRSVPDYIPKSYYKLGINLFQAGSFTEAVKALKAARQLFPDHSLREWSDYLLVESYEKLRDNPQIIAELNQLAQSEQADDLLKKAAEARLKVMDWEKQSKERL